ncbi:MAG: VWA domain-containing protein [Acidobacteria bacterium]|nr:MAG: VWA domain-containing protein [Acidobacteriota bacterium]
MQRFVSAAAAMAVCLSSGLLSQQAADITTSGQGTPTVLVDVKVVNVVATVRDKHGKVISNLDRSDFTLEEDSHSVAIQYFSRESDLPLTLGLLVDTSMSQRTLIDQERSASKTFLERVLRDKDSAFLIHFDREVELLQDLTSSKQKLESELDSLQTRSRFDREDSSGPHSPDSRDDNAQRGGERGMRRGGTQLYDAIFLASDELLWKQQGRKAIVVLSDGVDRGSKESLEGAIEAAQKSDTIVYSVLFKGEEQFSDRHSFGYPGMGGHRGGGGKRFPEEQRPDGKKTLERISKETGGRMFEISKKQSVEQIYSSIEEELRNQYSLGFTPEKADNAGYHKIVLKTKQKDAEVQTREGFYIEQ